MQSALGAKARTSASPVQLIGLMLGFFLLVTFITSRDWLVQTFGERTSGTIVGTDHCYDKYGHTRSSEVRIDVSYTDSSGHNHTELSNCTSDLHDVTGQRVAIRYLAFNPTYFLLEDETGAGASILLVFLICADAFFIFAIWSIRRSKSALQAASSQ